MTPEEKAKQLFINFAVYLRANLMYDSEADEDAKECALICVNELLNDDVYDMSEELFKARIEFLEKVKEELNKL